MIAMDDATCVSYATLLAAYRAERTGSIEALTYAQHIAERLIADDLFGQLAALREDLRARLWNGRSTFRMVEATVETLDAILGEA